jgi:hypothetical protein
MNLVAQLGALSHPLRVASHHRIACWPKFAIPVFVSLRFRRSWQLEPCQEHAALRETRHKGGRQRNLRSTSLSLINHHGG